MIKAIVFDCFGVLIGKGFWEIYKTAGGDTVKDADFIDDVLDKANLGKISQKELSKLVTGQLGISLKAYRKIVNREEKPNYDLLDFIAKYLKQNYKIGLLTNTNVGVLERKIPAKYLKQFFDEIVISAEAGLLKPDPEIYKLICERFGMALNEVLFVDDLQKYVDAAAALGMPALLYTDFGSLKKELIDLLGENWGEL